MIDCWVAQVLHQLLDEDENEVEVWYVLACAHMTAAAAAAALKGDAEATGVLVVSRLTDYIS